MFTFHTNFKSSIPLSDSGAVDILTVCRLISVFVFLELPAQPQDTAWAEFRKVTVDLEINMKVFESYFSLSLTIHPLTYFAFCSLFLTLCLHSIPHMCRHSLTLTPRRKGSWVSGAVTSSKSWTTLTPTGGKEAATAKRACSPATMSHLSTGTSKQSDHVNSNHDNNHHHHHHHRHHHH